MKLFPFIQKILGREDVPYRAKRLRKEKIYRSENPHAVEPHPESPEGRSRPRYKNPSPSADVEVADRYEELMEAVEAVNIDLEKRGSSYRFSVTGGDGGIYISLVLLDESGKVIQTERKDITHEEFYELIRNIERGEGFYVDTEG